MGAKKYIGQVVSIKFTDREHPVCGLVVDYNNEWSLMKYIPVDYVVDGYVLIKHDTIEGYKREKEEKFKEKVIKRKGLGLNREDIIPIDGIEPIICYLAERFGVFQIETSKEDSCYLGNLLSFDNDIFFLSLLNVVGKWSGKRKFKWNEIRVIAFDSDYINSLKLIGRDCSIK